MTELTRAEVVLGGNDTQLQNTLARAQRSMDRVGRRMGRMGRTLTARVTAPLAAIGGASVKAFADFDQAMTESLAIMGDVSDTMRTEMAGAAREVSQVTAASSKEAADAFFFLASAGLDAEQSIAALPQVARFAQAGMFDLSTATDLATDAQSALGLASDDAQENLQNMTRVTDALVGANALANASVQQFSESLTTEAGAAMKTFGIEVEEGMAVLAAFADQGVKGQRAGSGFSRVLRLMSQAAVNNKEEMKELGVSFFDAQGEIRPLADIIENLTDRLGSMSDAERAAALESIGFTARVQGIIQPLLGTSDAIREYEQSLRGMGGVTAEVSDKQMQSFTNQLKLIRNNVVNAAIVIGETLAPMVTDLAQKIGDLATKFSELDSRTQKIILAFGGLAAAVGPVLIVMGSLVRNLSILTGVNVVAAVGGWAGAFASLAVQVRSLSGAFALLQVAIGPTGWIILGATTLVGLGVARALENWAAAGRNARRDLDNLRGSLDELNASAADMTQQELARTMSSLRLRAETVRREIESIRSQLERAQQLPQGSGGRLGIGAGAGETRELEARLEALQQQEDELRSTIQSLTEQGRALTNQTEEQSDATDEAADSTRAYDSAASGAAISTDSFGTAMAFAGDMGAIFRNLLPEMGTGLRQMADASRESAQKMADLTRQMERVRAENERIKERARDRVESLVSSVRLEKMREDMRLLNDMADRMAKGFVNAFEEIGRGSKSVVEAITDMVGNILVQMARLQAQKMFASFFSGLMGGGIPDAPGPITGVEAPDLSFMDDMPGMQHGGRFQVAGAGGVDSQLVQFMATPGETVTVDPNRGSDRGGGRVMAPQVKINLSAVDDRSVREKMIQTGVLQETVKQAVRQAVEAPTKSDSVRSTMLSGQR